MTHIDGSCQENRDEYLRQLGKVSPAVRWYRHDLAGLLMWGLLQTGDGIDSRFVRRCPEMFIGCAEDALRAENERLRAEVEHMSKAIDDIELVFKCFRAARKLGSV